MLHLFFTFLHTPLQPQLSFNTFLFHETTDDKDNEGNTELDLSQQEISNSFCPRHSTFDLDEEPKDVCLNRFHQRLGSVLGFLAAKANETASGKSDESCLCQEFTQPIGGYSPEDILEIYEEVIPEPTRVILGSFKYTPKRIHSCLAKGGSLAISSRDILITLRERSDDPLDKPTRITTLRSGPNTTGRPYHQAHGYILQMEQDQKDLPEAAAQNTNSNHHDRTRNEAPQDSYKKANLRRNRPSAINTERASTPDPTELA
ncbi:hypothetical protein N7501_008307 [Penicillium viridicatum]|nr:hypothetical protein N7501_008307 [Penicillium viridicatum]